MRADDSTVTRFRFLTDSDAEMYFGEIDYRLRTGEHIQAQCQGQEDIFRFLSKYDDELIDYYQTLFGLLLVKAGSKHDRCYYYLGTTEYVKHKVPVKLQQPLKNESVLIGLFLWKLIIDFHEVNTVSQFKKMLYEDCEYKDDFFRLLSHVSDEIHIGDHEEAVDKEIEHAFDEFHRLGWIYREGDRFEIMPSFERLRMLYISEINNIDEL